jgi:uncharacterized protein YjdB
VVVDPESVSLGALGATAQLSATVEDANGHPVSAPVTWTSSAPDVASVDQDGLVTAVGDGTATITASSGGKTGSAAVTVSLPPSMLTVVIRVGQGDNKTIQLGSHGNTPVAVLTTSTASGEPVTFDASTVDASTVRFAGVAPVRWSLADVDGDGDTDLQLHFTTADLEVAPGNVTVTLTGFTAGGTAIEGRDTVTVLAPPSPPAPAPPHVGSVDVTPGSVTLAAWGSTQQLTATVRATDMSVMGGASVTWSSSAPGVASVDTTGLVTAVANGVATVTASSDGVSGTAAITVSQEAASVVVDPESVSLGALGATAQLSVTVEDANGHPMVGAALAWSSSDPGVASVDTTGLVTAVGNGRATVTATSGGMSAGVVVNVTIVAQPLTVVIFVKPGDWDDWWEKWKEWKEKGDRSRPINLDAEGVTVVVILTTSTSRGEPVTFNAASVNIATVRFAGAAPIGSALKHVGFDRDLDLVMRFRTADLELTQSSTVAVLEAQTYDGQAIRGEAAVRIVPPASHWRGKGTQASRGRAP